MTHLIVMAEGYPEGLDVMMEDIRNACVYDLKEGAKNEIGSKAQPCIREIRFYDIVVKEDIKDKVLGAMKPFSGMMTIDHEHPRRPEGHAYEGQEGYILHGEDGKGFNFKWFRTLVDWAFKVLNMKSIDMNKVEPNNDLANYIQNKRAKGTYKPWHGYLLPLGELKDGYVKDGPNKGRENS